MGRQRGHRSSWVFYVDALFGWAHLSGMENWGIAMVGLWVPAIINLVGIRQMAWFQNVTVVLKLLPPLFVGVIGWFFVQSAHFGPFNACGRAFSTAPSGSRPVWPSSPSSMSKPRRSCQLARSRRTSASSPVRFELYRT